MTDTKEQKGACHFQLCDQDLYLLPQKAIYWKNTASLLLADLHLGKVNHFRKAGIAIPPQASLRNYQQLNTILASYPIKQVIILGDLFHSVLNAEWDIFANWLTEYPEIKFLLIKGNHDILPNVVYEIRKFEVYQEELLVFPFLLSHQPLIHHTKEYYNLSGHIHPAVKLNGQGKQQLILPCFYFGKNNGLLPAFGSFTGKATIFPERDCSVFIIAGEKVLPVC